MNLTSVMLGVVLVFLRCFSMCVAIPALRAALGMPVTVLFSGVLALFFYFSSLDYSLALERSSDGKLLLLAMREVSLGLLFGFLTTFCLERLVMAGRLVDVLRGSQFAEQLAPTLGGRVSPFEQMLTLLALVLLFSFGGYQIVLKYLFWSGAVPSAKLFLFDQLDKLTLFARLSADTITSAVLFAGPLIVASLILNGAAALASRFLQRIPLVFEFLPLGMLGGALLVLAQLATFDVGELFYFSQLRETLVEFTESASTSR